MGLRRVNFVVMLIATKERERESERERERERDFLALFGVCEEEFIAKGVV